MRYAIIVAGGSGSRFGSNTPKQFLELAGMPVLMHTINKFAAVPDTQIIVVLPNSFVYWWSDLCKEYEFHAQHRVVVGGENRFSSVKNALISIDAKPGDIVAVHDGVRPLVSARLIEAIFEQAANVGTAIPVTQVTDSIRQVSDDEGNSTPLNRSSLRAVQTPQAFRLAELQAAYDTEFSPFFTDDASVYEHNGGTIRLIDGEISNIKITHPNDLAIAEMLIKE